MASRTVSSVTAASDGGEDGQLGDGGKGKWRLLSRRRALGLRPRRQIEPGSADPEHTGWCFTSASIAASYPRSASSSLFAGSRGVLRNG